jgi:hypothetical protein
VSQLDLFQHQSQQPKSAEQVAYEAWPFPGLGWAQYEKKTAQLKAACAQYRRNVA